MKSLLVSTLLIISTFIAVQAQNTIPDLQVKDLNGKSVNFKNYIEDGKITVLTFWASWCSPCKKELDNIAFLYPDWQEDYDLKLLAVTIDASQDLNKARSIVNSKAWDYEILADPNQELMRKMNFQAIPQTFLINQKGEIVYSHSGYVDGDEDVLEDEIKKLL